jgi:NADPH-dependent 7-cyano-7-deazaguanine reductase QueF
VGFSFRRGGNFRLEVARMIFQDLLEELANEIARLWSAGNPQRDLP